jgi:hypothetical protein
MFSSTGEHDKAARFTGLGQEERMDWSSSWLRFPCRTSTARRPCFFSDPDGNRWAVQQLPARDE